MLLAPGLLVTMVLAVAARWSATLAEIASNLASVPAWLGAAVLIAILAVVSVLRFLAGR
jgi:hypothetical protein